MQEDRPHGPCLIPRRIVVRLRPRPRPSASGFCQTHSMADTRRRCGVSHSTIRCESFRPSLDAVRAHADSAIAQFGDDLAPSSHSPHSAAHVWANCSMVAPEPALSAAHTLASFPSHIDIDTKAPRSDGHSPRECPRSRSCSNRAASSPRPANSKPHARTSTSSPRTTCEPRNSLTLPSSAAEDAAPD